MQQQSTPNAQIHARTLRREMTDSERKLWSRLRREQLGVKFRRQHPVGNYIADFVCLEPKLIVELDGSQHATNAAYDATREAYLESVGFAVLRFSTSDPLINMDGVLAVIHERVKTLSAPTPPSPKGEGDRPHPHLPPEGEGVMQGAIL